MKTVDAFIDVSVKGAKTYDKFQFERNGFFTVDQDSTPEKVGSEYSRKFVCTKFSPASCKKNQKQNTVKHCLFVKVEILIAYRTELDRKAGTE